MSKLDKLIEDQLNAEDRALFDQYGEKGLFGEVGELFAGKMGPWNGIQLVAQFALLAVGIYAGREIITTDDPAAMLRYGVVFIGIFIAMSVIKLMQWQQIQANRVIREVKRVELQIARSKAV